MNICLRCHALLCKQTLKLKVTVGTASYFSRSLYVVENSGTENMLHKGLANIGPTTHRTLCTKAENSPVLNPLEKLQKFVAVPLLPEDKISFRPSEDEISQASQLFVPKDKHKIIFLKSALFDQHLPKHELPEVAFIGRSNVGKSSLIKMLLHDAPEVRVRCSKTPGHTKLINFFRIGHNLCLVDMPGYGHKMPKHYVESVENFLSTRKKLTRVIFLVDGSVGVSQTDVVGLNMMEEMSVPYIVVMTKIDKTNPATLIKNFMSVRKYTEGLPRCLPQPFLVSSFNGDGLAMLQAFVAHVTGYLGVQPASGELPSKP